MNSIIKFINHYLGWRNWAVLTYNSIAENIFILLYVAFVDNLSPRKFTTDLVIFFLFSMFSTTYGYLINDLADKDLDCLHGKPNTFRSDSKGKATSIVILFLALSIILGIRFAEKEWFLPLWAGWFFIATFYSLKPIRLKERGKIGLAFVVLAQRAVPALMALVAFGHKDAAIIGLLTIYILFRGLSSDVSHQLADYDRDSKTDTETYAVKSGLAKTKKLFHFCLEAERSFLAVCLAGMLLKTYEYKFLGISFMLIPLLGYIALLGAAWIYLARRGSNAEINPFEPGRKDLFQFIHHGFPSVALPIYFLLFLTYENWMFVLLLGLFIFYRGLYSPQLMAASFPVRMVRRTLAALR